MHVRGVKLARSLIEHAEAAAKGSSSGGELSLSDAVALWEAAQDGPGVTDIERTTLQHIADNDRGSGGYTCAPEAAAYLTDVTSVLTIGERYYASVEGVQVDRTLWERAEMRARDGRISLPDARKLWVRAQDGPGVTQCEVRTMRLAIERFEFTDGARKFIEEKIAALQGEQ